MYQKLKNSDMSGWALFAHKIRDAIIASLETTYLAFLRVIAPSKRKLLIKLLLGLYRAYHPYLSTCLPRPD